MAALLTCAALGHHSTKGRADRNLDRVSCRTNLRACYAQPSTDLARSTRVPAYALCGTDLARRRTGSCVRACYGTSGTELGYAATRLCSLLQRSHPSPVVRAVQCCYLWGSAAVYGGSAAVYGCSAPIHGGSAPISLPLPLTLQTGGGWQLAVAAGCAGSVDFGASKGGVDFAAQLQGARPLVWS
eukprot:1280048-Rhodomonas_salina.3